MIPSLSILQRAAEIIQQIERHEAELVSILGGTGRGGSRAIVKNAKPVAKGASKRGRNMSAEGRARIAAAAKARWEKFRAAKKPGARGKGAK